MATEESEIRHREDGGAVGRVGKVGDLVVEGVRRVEMERDGGRMMMWR